MPATATALQTRDEPILLRQDAGGIATVTLNRPKQYNALSEELLTELQSTLETIAKDESVRVVVIAGTGTAFCAGHDLKQMRANPRKAYYDKLFAQCSDVMLKILHLPQPVIARVHGIATAAGCQLVAQCDLAVASDAARFTTPGVTWGFFCSTPGVAVGRNISRKRAMEMLLTGDMVDAQRALEWGLVNRVVPAAELQSATLELAKKLAEKPPAQVAAGKRAFYQQMDLGAGAAYELASGVISASFAHDEGRSGMDAFIEKRPPPKR
jgi:enoyl-CoA hydratase/carnithine racemase